MRRRAFPPLALPALLAAACLAGCGQREQQVVPVSGAVFLDGRPLAGAVLTFQPAQPEESQTPAGCGSYGRTDDFGRFELRLVDNDERGAVVGRHRVRIVTASAAFTRDDSGGFGDEPLPASWRDGSQEFVVAPGGPNTANFEIASASAGP